MKVGSVVYWAKIILLHRIESGSIPLASIKSDLKCV